MDAQKHGGIKKERMKILSFFMQISLFLYFFVIRFFQPLTQALRRLGEARLLIA